MEKELFGPIKHYFEALGYICDGEVKDIDLYMEKGNSNIAIELKETLDFKSVLQAADRQKTCDDVYIGIFNPKNMRSASFTEKLYLLKRLGIGLITVSGKSHIVNIVSEPVVTELSTFRSRNRRKRKEISSEFNHRIAKNNTGGVRGTKLITGYREDSLRVLNALCSLGGEASSKEIRLLSKVPAATTIMYRNHYGWFVNIKKGYYGLTEKGYDALEEFEDTLRAINEVDVLL